MRASALAVSAITLAACGDNRAVPDAQGAMPDAGVPALRYPVALPDDELAQQALALLGASVPNGPDGPDGPNVNERCNGCHGLTRQQIRYWRALSDVAATSCLSDTSLDDAATARTTLDCLRAMPSVATSDFVTKKLGIYAAAARLPWFQHAFDVAYGEDAAAELAAFQGHVQMPPANGPEPLTQEQFDIVAEWFARGVPRLDQTLPADPAPDTCTPGISSAVGAHVAALKQTGWRSVNRSAGMAMHGCGSATDPRDCLTSAPLAVDQPYGAGWEVAGQGHIRVLHDATYQTSYWTRSSPDGRFVAHGVEAVSGSYVIDLQRGVDVPIAADYDPSFFPDNSGFAFQGGANRNMCAISVLTSNPSTITMTEPACTRILSLEQYEHLGKLLGGGDFFGLDGPFVTDDGGKVATTTDPLASFTSTSRATFTPMIFDGTTFDEKLPVHVAAPFEGDFVLSPSAKAMLSRVAGPDDVQLGFVLREVDATLAGGTYTIEAPEIARYCISGGKPAFSFDERWVVFHHYETTGTANLWLMDLRTGTPVRITNMSAGQYALFPHFRSDGWIYAQVRDLNAGHEYTIASDAALVAEAADP